MNIILIKDVPKMGQKGEVKKVSNGYARNFLIPNKLAIMATPKLIKLAEQNQKQTEAEKSIHDDLLKKNLIALSKAKITIEEKANEKGHLFAQIHKEEILKALKEQGHVEIPENIIELDTPIKEIGEHKIKAGGKEFILEIKAIK